MEHPLTAADQIHLLEALTRLVGMLAWPGLAIFGLVYFGPALREFLADAGELSFKAAGFEATAKRVRNQAAAALIAAEVGRPDATRTPESAAREAKQAADTVSEKVSSRVLRRARQARVLWVDDRPDNNVYERQSLEALGVTFVLAGSTDEALEKAAKQTFDAVISDMGRPPDTQAGYTLLEQLRAGGNKTPFVIYASSNAPEHKAEARRRGAVGSTNRASELFAYVLTAIESSAR